MSIGGRGGVGERGVGERGVGASKTLRINRKISIIINKLAVNYDAYLPIS